MLIKRHCETFLNACSDYLFFIVGPANVCPTYGHYMEIYGYTWVHFATSS